MRFSFNDKFRVTFVNKVEADLAERYDLVYRFVADKAHLEYSVYKKELHEMIDDLQVNNLCLIQSNKSHRQYR